MPWYSNGSYLAGRWEKFYEIFLNALIFCLRKKALHTIYYTENSGSLLGAVA